MENQLFDAVQNGIRKAGKRPAVGGGSAEQLGGHEGDEREGGEEGERGGVGRREGFDGGERGEFDGYLSEPWTGDHHNAVDQTF